jgi:uncharacterized protein (TIGR02145 family)
MIGMMLYWNGTSWDTLRPGSQGQALLMCDGRPAWSVLGKCPGKIANFQCGNFTRNGTLIKGREVVDTWISIPYSGGNEGGYETLSMPSTNGISGLTATVPAGYFASGEGSLYAYISGTPSDSGTASFQLKLGGQTCQLNFPVLPQAGVSSLNCSSATLSGSIFAWTNLSGYSVSLPYSGGNGGVLDAQSIQSTGVTGLTASLAYDTLSNGDGQLDFQISGFPEGPGTAIFPISIRGISCNLSLSVILAEAVTGYVQCPCNVNGTLALGTPASGITLQIAYDGSNGGTYPAATVASTGITGLTAHVNAGSLQYPGGVLVYSVTGTPQNFGKSADFTFTIGNQTCTLKVPVDIPASHASCSPVNVHNPELNYGTVTDQDGNPYKTIKIGAQTWMAENLRTTHFQNGDSINPSTSLYEYPVDNCRFGLAYDDYEITDPRNLCPTAWHVPSSQEWTILTNFLGGDPIALPKMRSYFSNNWPCLSENETNSSGFSLIASPFNWDCPGDDPPPFNPGCPCGINNLPYQIGFGTSDNKIFESNYYSNFPWISSYCTWNARVRCVKNASVSDTASVQTLTCANSSISGSYFAGTSVSEGSITIPYNGGNAGLYFGQSVSSQGVEGLTATLAPGTLQQGNGSLQWIISGTPTSSGTASFNLSAGGKSCVVQLLVN